MSDPDAVAADLRKIATVLAAQASRWGSELWAESPRAAAEEAAAILSDAADELTSGVKQ